MSNKKYLPWAWKVTGWIGKLTGKLAAVVLKSIGTLAVAMLVFETAIAVTDAFLRYLERRRSG